MMNWIFAIIAFVILIKKFYKNIQYKFILIFLHFELVKPQNYYINIKTVFVNLKFIAHRYSFVEKDDFKIT